MNVIDGTYEKKRGSAVKLAILFGGLTASLFLIGVINAVAFGNTELSVILLIISFFTLLGTMTSGSYALMLEVDRANSLREALRQDAENFDPDDLNEDI